MNRGRYRGPTTDAERLVHHVGVKLNHRQHQRLLKSTRDQQCTVAEVLRDALRHYWDRSV